MREIALIGVIDGNIDVDKVIEDMGGIAVTIDDIDTYDSLDPTILDGIVLCGGTDVNPLRYGQEKHSQVWMVDHDRDELELRSIRYARETDIPILGICRGAQIINVAFGGNLHQHIDDYIGNGKHFMGNHLIEITNGSRLHRATKGKAITVNSLHHQAVDRLGDGLMPTAWSHDGIVECIESVPWHQQWIIGVQFHPEMMQYRSDMKQIVKAFLREARVHAKGKHPVPLRVEEVEDIITRLDVDKGKYDSNTQMQGYGWGDEGYSDYDSWIRMNDMEDDSDHCSFPPCRYPGGCNPREGDCLAEAIAEDRPVKGRYKKQHDRDLEKELEEGLEEMGFSVIRDYHYGG